MHQLIDGLENEGFTPELVTKLRTSEVLAQIKLVLMGLATIVRGHFKLACDNVFNPIEFFGNGWTVWKGPADGNGLEVDVIRRGPTSIFIIFWYNYLICRIENANSQMMRFIILFCGGLMVI